MQSPRHTLWGMCLRILLFLAFSAACFAQASFTGTIEDPSGAGIPNAAVRIVSASNGQARAAVADPQGRFRFDGLPPGTYHLRVDHPQFAVTMKIVTLSVGQALDYQL